MSSPDPQHSGSGTPAAGPATTTGTARVKRGMAEMLKGGVIMDVVTAEQARIAEDAGRGRRHGPRARPRRHPRRRAASRGCPTRT